jgi:hypothetical protein
VYSAARHAAIILLANEKNKKVGGTGLINACINRIVRPNGIAQVKP